MEAQITDYKHCTVVKVDGIINVGNAQELENVFKGLTDNGKYSLVFDMSDISLITSRGWWVLVQTQKECKRRNRGDIVLANMKEEIRDTLKIGGFDKLFEVYDDLTSAVGHF